MDPMAVFSELPEVPPGSPKVFTYIVFGLSCLKFLGSAAPYVLKLLAEKKKLPI